MRQVFTAVYSGASGGESVREVRILLNAELDGRQACYVYYDQDQNGFLLVNDQGSGTARLEPGGNASVENSQCRMEAAGSSVARSGNQLTLHVSLTFTDAFTGRKKIFLYAEDHRQRSTGLQPFGTWSVE